MRISTAQMQFRATNAMLDQYSNVSKTQNQLASGRRIIQPSDDPVGFTKLLPLRQAVDQHSQYQRNADVADTRLSQEDSTLDSFANGIIRINELAVQANNATLTAQPRAAIAQEVRQVLSELVSLGNSKDSNGEYIFAGDVVGSQPFTEGPPGTFTYNGDSGQRNLQIGASRQIAIADPGDDVFSNIPFSGGGTQDIFKTIADFATGLEANTPPGAAGLQDFKSALDHISTIRARVGARLNAIDGHRLVNEDLIYQGNKTISQIEDLDMAEAVSRLNLQMVGLQASQQAFTKIQGLSLFNYL